MPALDLPHRSEKLQSLTDGAAMIPLATDLGAKILALNLAGWRNQVVRAQPSGSRPGPSRGQSVSGVSRIAQVIRNHRRKSYESNNR